MEPKTRLETAPGKDKRRQDKRNAGSTLACLLACLLTSKDLWEQKKRRRERGGGTHGEGEERRGSDPRLLRLTQASLVSESSCASVVAQRCFEPRRTSSKRAEYWRSGAEYTAHAASRRVGSALESHRGRLSRDNVVVSGAS